MLFEYLKQCESGSCAEAEALLLIATCLLQDSEARTAKKYLDQAYNQAAEQVGQVTKSTEDQMFFYIYGVGLLQTPAQHLKVVQR